MQEPRVLTNGDGVSKKGLTSAPLSAEERRSLGKELRDDVAREAHAGWKAAPSRRSPVDILTESNAGRMEHLVPIRFGRMLQSPFAFYRGAAAIMAADLATTPTTGLHVQACGDAHLMNFGGFATPERNVVFDINDLDETLPAPFEWDLKRLTASMVIAGQNLELKAADAARVAEATVRSYREHMLDYSSMRALSTWYETISAEDVLSAVDAGQRAIISARLEKAHARSTPDALFPKLVEHVGEAPKIKDEPPLVFHPTAEQAPGLTSGFADQVAMYRSTLPHHVRALFDRYRLYDIALKVVGVGSVGTSCAIGLWMAADDDPLFLQIKEARTSVLEPFAGKSEFANNGERVVNGQRLMQSASDIFLGWFKGANGRDYYVRQLRDVKISAVVEGWDGGLLRTYGRLCGWALAKAHARSGDSAKIAGYMGSGTTFDEAIGEFAVEYADQNKNDYREFARAVRSGRIAALVEE